LNANDLAPILPGHDAAISCLGQRSSTDARLLQDAADATMTAMSRCGLRRYLVVSQGLLFPSSNPIITLLRLVLARHVADSIAMEHLVRTSETDWTIVRPPRLPEAGARAVTKPGPARAPAAPAPCNVAISLLSCSMRWKGANISGRLPASRQAEIGSYRRCACSEASCHSSGCKSRRHRSPIDVVVISSDGKGDCSVESLDVIVSRRRASVML
jgi:hypothetical protein